MRHEEVRDNDPQKAQDLGACASKPFFKCSQDSHGRERLPSNQFRKGRGLLKRPADRHKYSKDGDVYRMTQ